MQVKTETTNVLFIQRDKFVYMHTLTFISRVLSVSSRIIKQQYTKVKYSIFSPQNGKRSVCANDGFTFAYTFQNKNIANIILYANARLPESHGLQLSNIKRQLNTPDSDVPAFSNSFSVKQNPRRQVISKEDEKYGWADTVFVKQVCKTKDRKEVIG